MTFIKAAAMQRQTPISNIQKTAWNDYIDYLDKKGMKGNPALDNRDTGLSQQLFNDYKAKNPNFTLTYDQVPQVQRELQDYRADIVNRWKQNPSLIPDAKNENEIMPDLSIADGWLGSKTSSHKYPVAMINNSDGTVHNFGTNLSAYDAAMAKSKKLK
jgi:hypothetical protein